MQQYDDYAFPDGGILVGRDFYPTYAAGADLEDNFDYKDFVHEETWNDTLSGH
ncbi:MAG: hypothetical protein ABSH22_01495 [Tepidisphaeraceae bacterium]|jgi:hypothetical protein